MGDEKTGEQTQLVDASDSFEDHEVESLVGKTIAGKYTITRRIARGGMGVVYLAEHAALGRSVVFKVLSYHLSDDDKAKSRFEREARGLSVLDHPNIVTVHDFGYEEGLTYIVMEYVHGENLSQIVRREGRIPYDHLLPIMLQTIEALGAAHDKGIVHRDIKPSNIMVTERAGRDDFVKVLDFGLAKLAHSSIDLTKGNLVGTVSYLAPEVIKGGDATPASDVYSLGVMFYYLLAGSKPFNAEDDMSVLYQHVNEAPERLQDHVPSGEAPDVFMAFIHRCMAKDPAKRPTHAGEMREALEALVTLPKISAFSIESSNAIPRLQGDSSADQIRPQRHTPGGTVQAPPSGEITRPSIIRARSNRWMRIAVVAFTTVSIGLVLFVLLHEPGGQPDSASAPSTEPTPSPVDPTPAAEPKPTVFELVATPVGEVQIDDETHGEAPVEVELEPGVHDVSVSADGYQTWTRSVALEEGDHRRFDVVLSRTRSDAPAKTETIVKSTPSAPSKPAREKQDPTPPPDEEGLTAVDAGGEHEDESVDILEPEPPTAESDESDEPNEGALLPVDDEPGSLLPVD